MVSKIEDDDGMEKANHLNFTSLPGYAAFLLENKLHDFASFQLNTARKLNIPLLRFFDSFTEDELLAIGIENARFFLTHLANNTAAEFVAVSERDFTENNLTHLSQTQVVPEDITLVSYTRRSAFRHFLQDYTGEAPVVVAIMKEVDALTSRIDAGAFTILFKLKEDINKEIQSIAKVGNWVWELDKQKYVWSDELFSIYELPYQKEITFSLSVYNHPDDAEMIQRIIENSKQTHEPYDFNYRIILPDGRIKTLHARGRVKTDKNGVANKMYGTLQDVTQLEEKTQELRQSEERYHKMIEDVQEYAIFFLDRDGIIQNWNKGAEKIKGYTAEEIIGQHLRVFYTLEDRENKLTEKLLHEAVETGKVTNEGFRVRKDGTLFWCYSVITALRNNNNELIGFSKVTRDLTDKKIAEDRLVQYAQRLEQKNIQLEQSYKEVESFTYIASHDLQEPLRKIKTFTNLISQYEPLTEKAQSYFDRIVDSADRMQSLINSLLDYSHINDSSQPFREVDLNNVLDEVKNNLQDVLDEKHGEITAATLPVIAAVPVQIYQLFVNIIGNSVKYAKANTPIKIIIGYGTEEPAFLPATKRRSFHKISFTDNGIGFDARYAERIFDLFQRLHGKSEYTGTGIGLAICKKIVQNHGGYIRASGVPGQGAIFDVYLPVTAE